MVILKGGDESGGDWNEDNNYFNIGRTIFKYDE